MSDVLPYDQFPAPIGASIWDLKYRLKQMDGTPIDLTVEDTWRRIARALAAPEKDDHDHWEESFYRVLADFTFLPAGRIVAGAGAGRKVTLSNCYVMGTIPDSMDGIFTHLKEAALTMQAGGGIGYDFSTLRPKGAQVVGVAADASGPLTFMDVWDAMCRTVMSAGSRRGAMMATMSCEHPDVEDFIAAKHDSKRLRMFNLSVLVTDEFMEAVRLNAGWRLHFENQHGETLVEKIVNARELWDKIMRSTYDYAEPGVIFIDRINRLHNLWWIDNIRATNPCGEKAMGPYDSCLLGSMNLAAFVVDPYQKSATINITRLKQAVHTAIRMMDNVIDVNFFPLEAQRQKANETRQLGLGVTGLADALLMLGLRYGSDEAVKMTETIMREIAIAAYEESIKLAQERGSFPAYYRDSFLGGENFAATVLPEDLRAQIAQHGIRNSLLLSIAPTGTISLYAGNVSSGIEPIFAPSYTRKVLMPDGSKREELVEDYAIKVWHDQNNNGLPPAYVDAQTLSPADHVRMQAVVQKWVDSSISKTINLPKDISFEDFKGVYLDAYNSGCKGCTTYRPNDVTGSILSVEEKPTEAVAPAEGFRFHLRALAPSGAVLLDGMGIDIELEDWPQGEGMTISAVMEMQEQVQSEALPESRPEMLPGAVYKLKAGTMEHAAYVTITDITDAAGKRRPFEIFVNTKDPAHQAWMTALTRMVSAIFRRPYDSTFVVEELKAVFDPTFHAYIGGKPVPSLVAAIGGVIERHMKNIGYWPDFSKAMIPPELMRAESNTGLTASPGIGHFQKITGPTCQKCFSTNVKNESGCFTCLDCGSSKCG
jgi:ribonucleoside-diphosphate reductase alpha chain